MTNNKQKKLRVFETFAGIGAQHSALEFLKNKFGYEYEVVATSEWDVDANIAYNAMHHNNKIDKKTSMEKIERELVRFTFSKDGKTPATFKAIMNLSDEKKRQLYSSIKNSNNLGSILEITGESLLEATSGIDLLTYSFPCQDLSVAGGFHGDIRGMSRKSESRSGLLWEIERIVKQMDEKDALPKFLLLENVKNMISQRHIHDYYEWQAELKKLGYSTKTFVLNSYNYGLPQGRVRVYALSILNYQGKTNKYGEIMDMEDPEPIVETKTLKQLLKTNYKNEVYKNEALEAQPNRTPSRERMFNLNKNLLDFEKHKYTRTITTKQDRHPNAGVVPLAQTIIGGNNRPVEDGKILKANYRFLTTREAYMIMGFTEKEYNRVVKAEIRKEKRYQQAGNSIAVNVLVAIFNQMYKFW
ncbi:DNA (cytosine-5-)-methyltransferase [Mycoplasma todarodis]|uniref:DNA (cytosine-5-)-methyltransferase n=1 Tax=Mycoplasma todarodis TaxID=1937191 RepID=UPI003B34E404